MRRILIAFALVAAASPALAAERRYTVTDFERIQVDGPYEVLLSTGLPSSARATGSREAIDAIQLDVIGKTLRIRANQFAKSGNPGRPGDRKVTIILATRSLQSILVNGAGVIQGDKVRTMKLDLAISGSGRITIPQVEADLLSVTLLGSGRFELGGKAKSVRADIRGSGDLAAAGLRADDAQVHASTAGKVSLAVGRAAKIDATATGDVEIDGAPSCTVKQSGTGSVRCGRS
jgi:hypothetical protein